jgi:pilus assembly protein Flp/PilA
MNELLRFSKRLSENEDGATAIEYGLLAALLAVAIIATVRLVGGELNETFVAVEEELADRDTPDPD